MIVRHKKKEVLMMTAEELRIKWENFSSPRDCYLKLNKEAEKEEASGISQIKESQEYKDLKVIYDKFRNEFLVMYYPLVFKTAERISKKIKEVDIDDLVSWGTIGLYHAIDKFIPLLGNKFETYSIHRIKGSILDNIREVDWVPRLVRQRHSKIQKAKHSLECDLGRKPNDQEISDYLGMDLEDYLAIESKANPISCVSIYSGSSNDEGQELQLESVVSEDSQPLDHILRDEVFKKLMGRNFIPLERQIIHMHYYESMTMKEIAEKIGYSESRISQMHSKILERLQKKIALNPSYMKDLEAILQP